ncbi:MAG: hypothetical protein AAF773_23260, partial [Cyanobacteria bacterium P01_D01_bin.115]
VYTNSLNLDYTSKKYVAPFDKGAATAGDPPICSATLQNWYYTGDRTDATLVKPDFIGLERAFPLLLLG